MDIKELAKAIKKSSYAKHDILNGTIKPDNDIPKELQDLLVKELEKKPTQSHKIETDDVIYKR